MMRWLRAYIRPFYLFSGVFLYAAVLLAIVLTAQLSRMPFSTVHQEFGYSLTMIIAVIALAYGGLRAVRANPIFNAGYLCWLRLSPWEAERPLPAGPLKPAWQDAVILGLLSFFSYLHSPAYWHLTPLLCLLGYGGGSCIAFWLLDMRYEVYFSVFSAGLLCLLFPAPALLAIAWVGLLTFLILRLHRFLHRLAELDSAGHHTLRVRKSLLYGQIEGRAKPAILRSLLLRESEVGNSAAEWMIMGWPFSFFAVRKSPTPWSKRDFICISLLFGWFSHLLFALIFHASPPGDSENILELLVALNTGLLLLGVFARLLRYMQEAASPISLFGRLATRQFIIPHYDKIFVTPIAALLVYVLLYYLGKGLGCPLYATLPLALSIAYAVLLCGGPSREAWRYTGAFRLRTPLNLRLATNFQQP